MNRKDPSHKISFIERIKHSPERVRQMFSVIVSGSLTLVVVGTWILVRHQGLLHHDKGISENPVELEPFRLLKASLADIPNIASGQSDDTYSSLMFLKRDAETGSPQETPSSDFPDQAAPSFEHDESVPRSMDNIVDVSVGNIQVVDETGDASNSSDL